MKLNEGPTNPIPRGTGVTGYQVQFTLPVDNPVNKVRKTRKNHVIIFDIPINFPDVHNLGYADLLLAADAAEKLTAIDNP